MALMHAHQMEKGKICADALNLFMIPAIIIVFGFVITTIKIFTISDI